MFCLFQAHKFCTNLIVQLHMAHTAKTVYMWVISETYDTSSRDETWEHSTGRYPGLLNYITAQHSCPNSERDLSSRY